MLAGRDYEDAVERRIAKQRDSPALLYNTDPDIATPPSPHCKPPPYFTASILLIDLVTRTHAALRKLLVIVGVFRSTEMS
ncbi:hypothetical protein J6590_024016 [Homalodisca vitripennis]|nr:hypothetical protein J6590_024016 [Homalodisca vitripennis]